MTLQRLKTLSRVQIPDFQRRVQTPGDCTSAVGQESDRSHTMLITLDRSETSACVQVPDLERAIPARGNRTKTVGEERQVLDPPRMAVERTQAIATGRSRWTYERAQPVQITACSAKPVLGTCGYGTRLRMGHGELQ